MASFKISVQEHQKRRSDGKYPVSIRVISNKKVAYIKTGMYVVREQISKDFNSLKDRDLLRMLERDVEKYEKMSAMHFGLAISKCTAKEIVDYLSRELDNEDKSIDFIAFARGYVAPLLTKSHNAYGKVMVSVINSLVDFFDRDNIDIREITAKNLTQYASYLQSTRTMERVDQVGKNRKCKRVGVSDRTVADYMTKIRIIFNAAIDYYNDEDSGVVIITHYPFRKFKIKSNHTSKKRNLSVEVIRQISTASVDGLGRRVELARDVFMLSFYTVGTNLVDLYDATDISNGRLSYYRTKTKTRRSDEAFISIRIEPEAEALFMKYLDTSKKRVFVFSQMYKNHLNFVRAINEGLKQLCTHIGIDIPVTSYYARHSWATIARNDCRVPLEDINLALNHVDKDMRVTDIYIARDWSLIDEANRRVIDHVQQLNCTVV